MKRTIFILLSLLPVLSNATMPFSPELRGVHIVPLAQQNYSPELKKELLERIEEEKKIGYSNTENDTAKFLLNIEADAPKQILEGKKSAYGVYDTHLKKNVSEIKLFFVFSGIPQIEKENIIGYAAIGSYKKEKDHEGWNGVRVFFKSPLGVCSYSKSSFLAVQLTQETTEYFVNNKPSKKYIRGNPKNGFLYEIEWFDSDKLNTLECANKNFDPTIMVKLKRLAWIIDKGKV